MRWIINALSVIEISEEMARHGKYDAIEFDMIVVTGSEGAGRMTLVHRDCNLPWNASPQRVSSSLQLTTRGRFVLFAEQVFASSPTG